MLRDCNQALCGIITGSAAEVREINFRVGHGCLHIDFPDLRDPARNRRGAIPERRCDVPAAIFGQTEGRILDTTTDGAAKSERRTRLYVLWFGPKSRA